VLGTFASCGTGCGLNPQQEQLWANANGGFFASYPTSMWVPAGGEVWQTLRGTLTNMIPAGATGPAGDTMALLTVNTSVINQGTNAVPFDMTDRTYWINNATATANMQQIMMGTYEVNRTSFLRTKTLSLVLGCPAGDDGKGNCKDLQRKDFFNPNTYGPFEARNKQSPASEASGSSGKKMPFAPNITFPSAQCFAATNPTSNNGAGTIGRGSGTSGASRRPCVDRRPCLCYCLTRVPHLSHGLGYLHTFPWLFFPPLAPRWQQVYSGESMILGCHSMHVLGAATATVLSA
jgi:hypothetical protein